MSFQHLGNQLSQQFELRLNFCQFMQPVAKPVPNISKENKMITTSSKNNSLIHVEEICEEQLNRCLETIAPVQPQIHIHPIKRFLDNLLIHLLLFLGTDRWGDMLSIKQDDSHYMMRMDDIQNRWRHM